MGCEANYRKETTACGKCTRRATVGQWAGLVAGIMAEEVARRRRAIEGRVTAGLAVAVEQLLGRQPYERRMGMARWEEEAGGC
ncbi:MAG TPA: hypothetical protein DEP84_31785, partial [Chloroflexi bacterium]|nr:hypothetical protein [Chloroflexota bacterium]